MPFLSSYVIAHCLFFSGSTVIVNVTLEREDEISGPILAPFFPQVLNFFALCINGQCDYKLA
jgi:hypothetical protein